MSKEPKLTKAEAFRAILEEAKVDAIEEELEAFEKQFAGKSDEELSAELEKMGVSPAQADEIHAKQMKMIDEAKAKAGAESRAEPSPKPTLQALPPKSGGAPAEGREGGDAGPSRRRLDRRQFFAGFAVAATLAAALFAALAASGIIPIGHRGSDGGIIGPDLDDPAGRLRNLAFIECGKGHWESCVEKLDQAQGIDSKSNDLPEVKNARAIADAALHPEEDYDAYAPPQNNGRKRPPRGYDGGNVP